MRDVIQEFIDYNRPLVARGPEPVRQKVGRMAASPFAFFRGSFHLFVRDVLARAFGPLPATEACPLEIVGDIHPENYGTFKAADGVVHYDVNDFDEVATARFDVDVSRLAVGLFLAAREPDGHCTLAEGAQVALAGIQAYVETLRRLLKKPGEAEPDPSEGQPGDAAPVAELIREKAAVRRPDFIGRLTEPHGKGLALRRAHGYYNIADDQRRQAERLLEDYRRRFQRDGVGKDYYGVEDVCGRLSGLGSMGRLRYVVLVHGKGAQDGHNVVLEFKEALPSSLDVAQGRAVDAQALAGRAEQVIAAQRAFQAASSVHLGFAVDGPSSFQARELGPHDERVNLAALKAAPLEAVARVQGAVLARVNARAARRAVGPASPLTELADGDAFAQRALAFALSYADQVRRDWSRFAGARADLENVTAWSAAPSERSPA